MEQDKIEKLVLNVINSYCASINLSAPVDLDTPLIGANRLIDSMGLVNILVDIENVLIEENFEILIMSENAMSLKISPFRTIGALIQYILREINTNKENE
jgi:acyl carrier protein